MPASPTRVLVSQELTTDSPSTVSASRDSTSPILPGGDGVQPRHA